MSDMNPVSDIETFRERLTALSERAGPDTAVEAKILAGELRAAHGKALEELYRAAAALHKHHGWTPTRLCVAIYGRPNKVAYVRQGIEAATPYRRTSAARAEETFNGALQRVRELWTLYKQAKAIEKAAAASEEPEPQITLDLPETPLDRAKAAAAQLAALEAELDQVIEQRNCGAAALAVHAGWTKRQAAQLAKMAVRDLYPYEKDAKAEEADPQRVFELGRRVRELQARRSALVAARDEAIRQIPDMGPSEIAREIGRTDPLVVRVRRTA